MDQRTRSALAAVLLATSTRPVPPRIYRAVRMWAAAGRTVERRFNPDQPRIKDVAPGSKHGGRFASLGGLPDWAQEWNNGRGFAVTRTDGGDLRIALPGTGSSPRERDFLVTVAMAADRDGETLRLATPKSRPGETAWQQTARLSILKDYGFEPDGEDLVRRPRRAPAAAAPGPAKPKKPARELFDVPPDGLDEDITAVFSGRYAGLDVRVKGYGIGSELNVSAEIVDPDTGKVVGKIERRVAEDDSGDLFAEHVLLQLEATVQGQGFAQEFNASLEAWYIDSGIDRIEVRADIDVGGYTWARQGYDFRDGVPDNVIRSMEEWADARAPNIRIEELRSDDSEPGDPGWMMYVLVNEDTGERIGPFDEEWEANWERDEIVTSQRVMDSPNDPVAVEVFGILERIRAGEQVSAYEISQIGRPDGAAGRDATWPGKEIMLGSDWHGTRWL